MIGTTVSKVVSQNPQHWNVLTEACLRPAQAGPYAENKEDITWAGGTEDVTVRFRALLFESEMCRGLRRGEI